MSAVAHLKVPPHSIDAEQALLAAMISNAWVIADVDFLTPDEFYRTEHQVIYTRLQALAASGKTVDAVLLLNALEGAGELNSAGGAEYIVDLVASNRGAANTKHYAQIIRERALARRLIRVGNEICDLGWTGENVRESIDKAQALCMSVQSEQASEPKHINQILTRLVDDIDRRHKLQGKIIGLETGFADLDKLTSGLCPGQLVLVAGRPSMGKTQLALNIAENVTLNDGLVVLFSLEMPDLDLGMRSVSSLSRVSHEALRQGNLGEEDWPKITSAFARLKGRSLYVDDQFHLTSAQLLSRARKIAQKLGREISLIVVDYIQLLSDRADSQQQKISDISRNLKLAAGALNCPVIAISQLNREVEKRPNKRPLMADLRDSGALEQDADVIAFVYRDEVYNEDSQHKGIAEVIVRKQRNGPIGTVYLASRLDIARFENLTHMPAPIDEEQPARGGDRFAFLDR